MALAARATRASWWRRLWARDIEVRLDVRRRRHDFGMRYPQATWEQRQRAAGLDWLVVHGDFLDSAESSWELEELTQKMGPSERPWEPMPHLALSHFEKGLGGRPPPSVW